MTANAEALPQTMTAIEIAGFGGPERLVPTTRPVPRPAPGELLVKVAAAGDLPGLEIAGKVVALGAGVEGWKPGDRLCALLAGGGYAEYAAAPAPQCLPIPKGLSEIEAAALPETFFTVWTNVFERGRLQPGESFLVHGGASGIGTTAIQLARAWGARVFATAGDPEKCRACERLGAEKCVDYKREDFVEVLSKLTDGKGVDVILDMVGGDYVARNLKLLAVEGRCVQIAFLRSPVVEINLMPLMLKRATFTGSTLRARTVAQKGAVARAVETHVWPLIAAGKVKPVIHKTFPLAAAADAHRLMEASGHIGKLVLTVP